MMRKIYLVTLAALVFMGCGSREAVQTSNLSALNVVPQPVAVTLKDAEITLNNGLTIVADGPDAEVTARHLKTFLTHSRINENPDGLKVQLAVDGSLDGGSEAYRLSVTNDGIQITGGSGAGLFYGAQTLIQLLETNSKSIRAGEITDYPRFPYRGLHLDVVRHTFPPEFIKKYIDLLAYHKMNRFHWHLTDDQGWRIEIKRYPKLQEIAAFRDETVIGHASTASRSNPKDFDGQRYGGYYTQDEVRDIVKYAADRYVTIVPEIEMPGHAQAALSAYPELGCTGGPYKAATTWGVFDDVFCAGKEQTFAFLEGVLDEVIDLFPGKYVHVGGDECPKTRWKTCPNCQKRIKNEKLKDEHHLQSYFIQRMEKYLNSKGKQIIGWDEILEGGLAPNATVMSWRGEEGGIEAAQQKHDVIMTPGNWCYFDNYQDTTIGKEPLAIGGFTPVSEVYEYEPVPPQLSAEEAKHILGAQANLWTEYIKTSDHAEYMVYPRACALAEVVWSPKGARDYAEFEERLKVHLKRLDLRNVNYARHILKDDEKVSTSGSN